MSLEVSHGKLRPRPLRMGRVRSPAAAELAAPFRDPKTGHFTAGNPGGRLRQVAALGKLEAQSLLRLSGDVVAPWLRPHLADAQRYVQGLVDALPAATDELVALCGDEARARLLAAACAAEGARADTNAESARAWRLESRQWAQEARQTLLTRKAIERDTPKTPSRRELAPWERPATKPKGPTT